MHDRILDVSNFLSQHPGAKFDMFHPLDVIVNFAQEAVNASLWDLVVNQVCVHASHVSAVSQFAPRMETTMKRKAFWVFT